MKKTIYIFYAVVSAGLALYMLMPSQNAISEFPSLPNSIKSSLEGDTTQIPNVVAYFSNNYRSLSVNYFARNYMMGTFFPFEPLRFNYPPEFAFAAIKDQTQSTYLEELTYPLRDSLFINGLEPFDEITKEGMIIRGAIYLKEMAPSYSYRKILGSMDENKKGLIISD